MKCLTLFLIGLVLLFNFSNAFNSNKVSKNHSKEKNLKNKNHKSDPSHNPLPKQWTSGHKSDVAFQTNKKHQGYLKRLAGVHRYSETTDRILRKAAKSKKF